LVFYYLKFTFKSLGMFLDVGTYKIFIHVVPLRWEIRHMGCTSNSVHYNFLLWACGVLLFSWDLIIIETDVSIYYLT
jgi:hypothetical protein